MATILGLVVLSCFVILPHAGSASRVLSTNRSMAGYVTKPLKDGYRGFTVTMDVYGFYLSPGQLNSYGGVWVKNYNDNDDGTMSSFDGIQIGWRVVSGDERPVFYLVCTMSAAGSRTTSVDIYCPGFQPESGASTLPVDVIPGVSEPNGAKQYITLKVLKDSASGDWLVYCGFNRDPELISRLPKSIFTGLAYKATDIWFGGMGVNNATFQPTPVLPPMGSGYMAVAGSIMAASMSNLQLIDEQGRASPAAKHLIGYSSNQKLYSFTCIVNGQFFYGGPLQSPTRPSSEATSCTHAIYSILLVLFTYWF